MEEAQDQLLAVIASAGALVGVPADQVALQTSATAAWLRAFGSIPLQAGDRILTTKAEYASNVLPMLQAARRAGASVEFIPDGSDGTVDPAALAAILDERVKLSPSPMLPARTDWSPMPTGSARYCDVLAAMPGTCWMRVSLGQLPVDMNEIGADFIAATGRKFLRGPRGTGFLAVSPRVLNELEPVPIDMFGTAWDGDQGYELSPTASRYQSFEMSYSAMLGLGAAIDYALTIGIDQIRARINSWQQHCAPNSQRFRTCGCSIADRRSRESWSSVAPVRTPGQQSANCGRTVSR